LLVWLAAVQVASELVLVKVTEMVNEKTAQTMSFWQSNSSPKIEKGTTTLWEKKTVLTEGTLLLPVPSGSLKKC
jgi:hypothetical protein